MDFVHSGRAASPRCGSRCGRQEVLPPRARVPGRVRACVRGMLAAGFCPVRDDCATQYPRTLSNPVPPPGRQVLAPVCAAPRGGAPLPPAGPAAPAPPSGRWLGKWIRLVFSEPRSRGGAGRRLPRSQGRAPASSPSPAPPEGLGTKVLCTGRKHLITSTSGMGPRGPPARREGAGRKGAGAGPQVGTSSPLRLRKGWGDPRRRSVPSTRAIPGWAKGAIS